ncbi:carotenoid oxygenase [Amycolatopsis rhizosphaerae]|uniref:Dioxygenase n=1 Tax=Amycolatopsis rhizosphaerae TaxID=2053003 RepID=A0A558D6Q0_9PSEU|nr:carotenoid oxygenase family protein [Amycolatopsis rhizosphaerae]TVT56692.1 carotenoid oxygenase [Amycolatopsis rhizosphaerae]
MGNPYLEGNYRPVEQESTLFDLEVTGTIPAQLDGRFLRIGPNPVAEVDPRTYHWFMGDGMAHGVRLREGRAEWYRSRWIKTPALGGPPGVRYTIDSLGANTNIIAHAGTTLALIEGGVSCYELSDELDTLRAADFDGTLTGGYTAHPLRDPATGELHAVSYFFGWGNKVRYTVIGADGRLRRQVDVRVGGSPMMHSFSLTETYVVFYDLPVVFDTDRAVRATVSRYLHAPARLVLSALIGRISIPGPVSALMTGSGARAGHRSRGRLKPNAGLPYSWDPAYPARIGIMPRQGGANDVRWFEIDPCYVYHPMNAYDDGGNVVLDVIRHDRTFDRNPNGPDEAPPTVDQWVINPTSGRVTESRVDDRPQEFPRIDERLIGKRHRFGYATGLNNDMLITDLVKHDYRAGTSVVRTFVPGASISEFVFQPSAPGAAEDDGVLMGYVHNAATDRTDLMLLDAQTLDTVAAIHLPTRVPNGFHGNWAPTASD